MRYFLVLLSITFLLSISSCATTNQKELSLEAALNGKAAIPISMRLTEKGRIILEGLKINGRSLDMLLDTGATQSAIFQAAQERVGLSLKSDTNKLIHGITDSRFQRIATAARLELGPLEFLDKSLVVLDGPDLKMSSGQTYDGLIGMDVLSDYQIYISPAKNELWFFSNDTPVDVSYFWPRIFLIENPFKDDNRALHFVEIRIDGRNTAALLDTGAEFSVMNWSAASYSQAKPIRKRLKEQWIVEGSVGTFRPTAKLKLDLIRGGQIYWEDKEFVVMDFQSLDVLGVEEQPFMIAGMNLFQGEALFIDFERGFLTIIPKEADADIFKE